MSFCKLPQHILLSNFSAPLVSSLSLFLFTSLFSLCLMTSLILLFHLKSSFFPPLLEPWPRFPALRPSPNDAPLLYSALTFFYLLHYSQLWLIRSSLRALLQTPSSFLSLQIKILTLSLSLFVSPSFYVQCQSLAPPTPLLRLVF